MVKEKVITVGELRRFIKESSKNEFNPVLGVGVEKDNKSNNEKTYKETERKIKDFDGGLSDEKFAPLPPKEDYNRTTLDYTPRVEPSKEYKERVEAQAKGYTSKMEEKNGIEKSDQYDKEGKILKQFKDSSEKINKEKTELAHSGLQARELEKAAPKTLYENKKPVTKKLTFKREFLSESNMISKIPDVYKVDGQRIHMVDSANNEYIVECRKNEDNGLVEPFVVSFKNERLMNEQMDRINKLFEYKNGTTAGRTSKTTSLNEEQQFKCLMDSVRGKK